MYLATDYIHPTSHRGRRPGTGTQDLHKAVDSLIR
ncbi:MAG: hypothetical protein AVDCRST_MAG58-3512 [uncultured Rubrobacteraceae bacterium]|uniref:Uncharacterized protein n=1 Tax=uncultured Rubrobacteraceae bacterium TaxID=349277 RepID=A0A6J4R8X5_9ACTN|nr:MAG: hypothetical protein AVDCRST_MAG58-3512 [uncultured Rubrobacteraceae bacterium]